MDHSGEVNDLNGSRGHWRSDEPNAYSAANDFEAVRAWIQGLHDKDLPERTLMQYVAQVERFMLWAVTERKKAMSSIDIGDLQEFERFLAAPPLHWRGAAPTPRLSTLWRPMRKGLSSSSIAQAGKIIVRLYSDWRNAGYLSRDPLADWRPVKPQKMLHWLTTRDWMAIEQQLRTYGANELERRTRLSILLMRRCSLAPAEVLSLSFQSLTRVMQPSARFAIPLSASDVRLIDAQTWEAIEAHYSDRVRLLEGNLQRFGSVPDGAVPLVGAIYLAGIREVTPEERIYAGHFPTKPNILGTVTLKTFTRCAFAFFTRLAESSAVDRDGNFLKRARGWLDAPNRQTLERRRVVLARKIMGLAVNEMVDEPKVEQRELFELRMRAGESFRF